MRRVENQDCHLWLNHRVGDEERTYWSELETRRRVSCMERCEDKQKRGFQFEVSSKGLLADCSLQK
jgi:hypothetical protein